MNQLRPGLPPLPPRMSGLPIDDRGFPVPYFVAIIDGKPDHRIADTAKVERCLKQRRCWLCGGFLEHESVTFVVGPVSGITQTSGEPPSHDECGRYACTVCPFLARPHAKRRGAGLPDIPLHSDELHATHNPGVTLLWQTKTFQPFRSTGGTILFRLGAPTSLEFFAQGRAATRNEADDALALGIVPLFAEAQEEDRDRPGCGSIADITWRVMRFKQVLNACLGSPNV